MAAPASFVPILHQPDTPQRRFVLLGRHAASTEDFSLDDLPTSGGRMDIIARCIRAVFLLADGIRRNARMDIVLLGGDSAPTTLRIDGSAVRFLRPDERRLAGHIRHVLGVPVPSDGLETVAPGIQRAPMGLFEALTPWFQPTYVLDREGNDVRELDLRSDGTFVLGDHTGLTQDELHWLCDKGATRVSLGPVAIHAEDAIAVLHNEIDRQLEKPL
jgi:tRNA (pseudouridine54-N1)-methyltransferase